jgi:hypothetical protein
MEYNALIVKGMMTALFNQPGGRDQFNLEMHLINEIAMAMADEPDGNVPLSSLMHEAVTALRNEWWHTLADRLAAIQRRVNADGL